MRKGSATKQIAGPRGLGEGAFHGIAGEIVRAIEPNTEADPAAMLVQLLAAFGFLAGRCAYFLADGTLHFPNLFVVIVGETAKSRKGTSWSRVRSLVESLRSWPRERVMTGLSSGEGLIAQLDDSASDKRLLVVQTEFGSVLQVMTRSGNTLSDVLRDAWDGTDLRVMTRTNPLSATGVHVSVVGHITSDELMQRVDQTDLWNGFANRFLWCCASRARLLPHGGTPKSSVIRPLARRLEEAAKWARRLRAKQIGWDRAAAKAWERVYGQLAKATPGLLGAIVSRAEAQVVRLALIYALLDKSDEIRRDHLEAALAVWNYCESSTRFIFGELLGDPVANKTLAALRTARSGMTRTEINRLFLHHRSKPQLDRALATLQSSELAEKKVSGTGGRPVERWFAVSERPKALPNGTPAARSAAPRDRPKSRKKRVIRKQR